MESQEDSSEKIKTLKSFGVFIKHYNMSHLLATRYTLKEDFGIAKSVAKIDELDRKIKEDKNVIENKEKNKKEDNAKDLEALRSKYGQEIDDFKKEVKNANIDKFSSSSSSISSMFISWPCLSRRLRHP